MDKAAYLDFVIEIIRRSDDQKGFRVLPLRWVAERTFGLDDPMANPRARLRAAHRRLWGGTLIAVAGLKSLLRCRRRDTLVPRHYGKQKR